MPTTIYPDKLTITQRVSQWQARFLDDQSPLVAAFGGRGAGKTRVGAEKAVERRIEFPATLGLAGASTHPQTRGSTMKEFLKVLRGYQIPFTVDRRPKDPALLERMMEMGLTDFYGLVTLPNGSGQYFRTMKNYDALRGFEWADIWFDESREIKFGAYEALSPALRGYGDIPYQVIFTTSPNGFDWCHQVAVDDGHERHNPDASWHHATSHDNPFLHAGYVDQVMRGITDSMVEQEIMARFVQPHGSVWPEIEAKPYPEGNLIPYKFDPGAPVEIGMDFGTRQPCVLLIQKIRDPHLYGLKDQDGRWLDDCEVIIDELMPRNIRVDKLAERIQARRITNPWRTRYQFGKVCYDPAGEARNSQTNFSDADVMRKDGFRLRPMPSSAWAREIRTGLNLVGSRWCNAKGERRLFFACKDQDDADRGKSSYVPLCLSAFQTYSYPEADDDKPLDEKPEKGGYGAPDHPADALRYHQVTSWLAKMELRGGRY